MRQFEVVEYSVSKLNNSGFRFDYCYSIGMTEGLVPLAPVTIPMTAEMKSDPEVMHMVRQRVEAHMYYHCCCSIDWSNFPEFR